MISPRQIPAPDILLQLNRRIVGWAAERPLVHLFPVGHEVRVMKEQGIELPLEDGKFHSPPGSMLQGDRLHPNCLGMAWVGFRLQQEIAKALDEERAAALPQWTIDEFVELCGAEMELEDLQVVK